MTLPSQTASCSRQLLNLFLNGIEKVFPDLSPPKTTPLPALFAEADVPPAGSLRHGLLLGTCAGDCTWHPAPPTFLLRSVPLAGQQKARSVL